MMKFVFATIIVFLCQNISLNAQVDIKTNALEEISRKNKAHKHSISNQHKRVSGQNIECVFLKLELEPNINNGYLLGKASYVIKATGNASVISFDLRNELTIDSIVHQNQKLAFNHRFNVVTFNLPTNLNSGQLDSFIFYYQGKPDMTTRAYSRDVVFSGPIISTLSEPYGSSYWWPCRENLNDKIDSIEIQLTTDTPYIGVSNGVLKSVQSNANKKRYTWKHTYPIAPYLVAISISRYANYKDNMVLKSTNTPLEIENYVFPQNLNDAKSKTVKTVEIMNLFDSLYGTYPFYKEKYGHTQFTWGGGMEHQTNSFMVNFSYDLIAHELAHQWFGDKVTCGSWSDLWLNEAFATYSNLLCYDFLRPRSEWLTMLKSFKNDVLISNDGSVKSRDTLDVDELFNYRTTYQKGAMVLHQLRWTIGDQAFFNGIKSYLNAPNISYGFAFQKDLKYYFEQSSGMDLTDYFNDWILGEGHPNYKIIWTQNGKQLVVDVIQSQSHPSVDLFNVPIPIMVKSPIKDTLIVINTNNKAIFTYYIDLPFKVKELVFDPEEWLLAKHEMIFPKYESVATLLYPNPSDKVFYVSPINFDIENIVIYDVTGKQILTRDYTQKLRVGEIDTFNIHYLNSGIYFVNLIGESTNTTQKIIIK